MRVWRRLATWAEDEAQSAGTFRRLRETALEYENNRTSLWRDPELRVALDWREKNKPTPAWAEMYGGDFDTAMDFLKKSEDEQDKKRIEAEVEARWQSTWRWVPLVLTLVAFVWLQVWLSKKLNPLFDSTGQFQIKPVVAAIVNYVEQVGLKSVLSHLLAGMPAAVGYLLLSPYIKKRFPVWENHLVVFWTSKLQGTPGMRLVGILVTDKQGYGLSWLRASGRFFARFLSFYALGLGFLMQPFNKEGQAWHDRLSGTVVLRRTPATAQVDDVHELPYASFGRRTAASLLDGVLIFFVWIVFVFAMIAMFFSVSVSGSITVEDEIIYAVLIFSLPLVAFIYHVACWGSWRQATFGMMLSGIFVTDSQRRRLSRYRAAGRFFGRLLSYVTLIGILMQLFTKQRQTLHDRLSGTLVLQGEPTTALKLDIGDKLGNYRLDAMAVPGVHAA